MEMSSKYKFGTQLVNKDLEQLQVLIIKTLKA
jgi:hypothetical protein